MAARTASDIFGAIAAGQRDVVRRILAEQPDAASTPNPSGLSPLLVALYSRQPAIADDLLAALPPERLSLPEAAAAGVVPRLQQLVSSDPQLVNAFGADGFPPLALAAFFGRRTAVELLLNNGADVDQVARHEFRITALHAALAGPEPDIARLLVAAGADVNVRQQSGFTPLHTAAANGYLELAQLLVEHGADARATNDAGRTPADLAHEAGHSALANYLERSG